ncbi:MAG TPA: hypothetical protein GXX35_13230 [Thermoanaerobacterales bacterium]|nr:hypothetical protein [Thermoanaerobacterales bacterium]
MSSSESNLFKLMEKVDSTFTSITGQSISFIDNHGRSVFAFNFRLFTDFCKYIIESPRGYQKCMECNGLFLHSQKDKYVVFQCHIGLTMMSVTIIENDECNYCITSGQVLMEGTQPKEDILMQTVAELLKDNVTLEVECIDRIYLNGYIPSLQTGGHLVTFLTKHRNQPIPSPALLGKISEEFRFNVKKFATENSIPIIEFKRGQRKDEIALEQRRNFKAEEGVVFIGVAQFKKPLLSRQPKRLQNWVSLISTRIVRV